MAILRFVGHVSPLGIPISSHHAHRFGWAHDGVAANISCEITDSKIEVICDVAEPVPVAAHAQLLTCAEHVARLMTNLIALSEGVGLHSWIDHLEQDGEVIITYWKTEFPPPFLPLCGPDGLKHLLSLTAGEPSLMMALNDLIGSMTNRFYSTINFARIIDTLKYLVDPAGSWASLHAALNVTKEYCEPISETSKDHRHGNYVSLPRGPHEIAEVRTWELMRRFLAFRENGSIPLREPLFKQL